MSIVKRHAKKAVYRKYLRHYDALDGRFRYYSKPQMAREAAECRRQAAEKAGKRNAELAAIYAKYGRVCHICLVSGENASYYQISDRNGKAESGFENRFNTTEEAASKARSLGYDFAYEDSFLKQYII